MACRWRNLRGCRQRYAAAPRPVLKALVQGELGRRQRNAGDRDCALFAAARRRVKHAFSAVEEPLRALRPRPRSPAREHGPAYDLKDWWDGKILALRVNETRQACGGRTQPVGSTNTFGSSLAGSRPALGAGHVFGPRTSASWFCGSNWSLDFGDDRLNACCSHLDQLAPGQLHPFNQGPMSLALGVSGAVSGRERKIVHYRQPIADVAAGGPPPRNFFSRPRAESAFRPFWPHCFSDSASVRRSLSFSSSRSGRTTSSLALRGRFGRGPFPTSAPSPPRLFLSNDMGVFRPSFQRASSSCIRPPQPGSAIKFTTLRRVIHISGQSRP